MAHIGFIGLGHMGLPMAQNLIKAGHEVIGFDLQSDALQALAKAGGEIAENLGQITQESTIIITMLQTGKQVYDVCLGPLGIYSSPQRPLLHIDCSSIDVESSRTIQKEAQKKGIDSVDAPVSGGVAGAFAATLTFMVGGSEANFAKAKNILSCLGKKIIHTGDTGSGQAAKICNNMILGISMIAISEAFKLGEQLGLNPKKLFEVVENSSGQCWAMSKYVPVPGILENVPANCDYQPGFTVAMMLKDLNLSQEAAHSVGLKTKLGHQATEIYQAFAEQGMSQLDFSAIIKATTGA